MSPCVICFPMNFTSGIVHLFKPCLKAHHTSWLKLKMYTRKEGRIRQLPMKRNNFFLLFVGGPWFPHTDEFYHIFFHAFDLFLINLVQSNFQSKSFNFKENTEFTSLLYIANHCLSNHSFLYTDVMKAEFTTPFLAQY